MFLYSRRLIGSLLLALWLPLSVSAQSIPSGEQTSPAGGRPESSQADFLTLLESAGDAMLSLFRGEEQQPDVDDPQWDSLASPRDTVMTFVEAMNHVAQGRFQAMPRAAKTFGAADLANPDEVAMELLEIFDRLPDMSPGAIPGRDDVQEKDIHRYELFPRGIDRRWAYKAIDGPIKNSILLTETDGQWHFDQRTLEQASQLLETLRPIPPRPRIERQGQLFWNTLEPTITKSTLTDYVMLVLAIAGGIAVAYGLYRLRGYLADRRVRGRDNPLLATIEAVLYPLMILAITSGIAIGTTQIHLHPTLAQMRWSIVEIALVLAGVWLVISVLELICLGVRQAIFGDGDPYARMMSLLIRRSLRVFVGVLLLLFVLQNVFAWNITAVLGGFGILAIALSLAAKDAVKNLFGAATIFINRPFLDGDWIKFEGQWGQVEDVSLQVTRIRVLSGEMLIVPNMKFIDEPIENLSMRKYLRRVMNIAITYDTPADKVREALDIIKDILSSDEVIQDGQCDLDAHPPRVWFERYGDYFLSLRADYWYLMDPDENQIQRDTPRGWFSYLDHCTVVNLRLLERFNAAGINFAFPTRTIKVEQEDVFAVERASK